MFKVRAQNLQGFCPALETAKVSATGALMKAQKDVRDISGEVTPVIDLGPNFHQLVAKCIESRVRDELLQPVVIGAEQRSKELVLVFVLETGFLRVKDSPVICLPDLLGHLDRSAMPSLPLHARTDQCHNR